MAFQRHPECKRPTRPSKMMLQPKIWGYHLLVPELTTTDPKNRTLNHLEPRVRAIAHPECCVVMYCLAIPVHLSTVRTLGLELSVSLCIPLSPRSEILNLKPPNRKGPKALKPQNLEHLTPKSYCYASNPKSSQGISGSPYAREFDPAVRLPPFVPGPRGRRTTFAGLCWSVLG